jgi:hypothetical protein
MTPRPIRSVMRSKRAQTLVEMLIASVISVILFTSGLGVFVVARTFYLSSMAGQELQRDVNSIADRMVKGVVENNVRIGLRSAASISSLTIGSIDFRGPDGTLRKYYLGTGGIYYDSPMQSPNPQIIYNNPSNTTLTLWFWYPYADQDVVGIYIALARTVSGRTISGSVATFVNLRNVQ